MREELEWGWARDRKPQRAGEEQGSRAQGWAAGLGTAWSRPASGNLTTSAPLGGATVASRVGKQCRARLGANECFPEGDSSMCGLSPRVIVPQSALSRVIAAWSAASAHPLAPGPANRWQQMRERKSGRSRSSRPWPHLLPYLRSLRVCVPTAMRMALRRSGPRCCPDPGILTDTTPSPGPY